VASRRSRCSSRNAKIPVLFKLVKRTRRGRRRGGGVCAAKKKLSRSRQRARTCSRSPRGGAAQSCLGATRQNGNATSARSTSPCSPPADESTIQSHATRSYAREPDHGDRAGISSRPTPANANTRSGSLLLSSAFSRMVPRGPVCWDGSTKRKSPLRSPMKRISNHLGSQRDLLARMQRRPVHLR